MSKGVSFESSTGMTRSVGGLFCRGGRFGDSDCGEGGLPTAVVTVLDDEGSIDGGVINTLSGGEVAILDSISGVVGVG